jgi:hypothetical protein
MAKEWSPIRLLYVVVIRLCPVLASDIVINARTTLLLHVNPF